eukprot:325085_1
MHAFFVLLLVTLTYGYNNQVPDFDRKYSLNKATGTNHKSVKSVDFKNNNKLNPFGDTEYILKIRFNDGTVTMKLGTRDNIILAVESFNNKLHSVMQVEWTGSAGMEEQWMLQCEQRVTGMLWKKELKKCTGEAKFTQDGEWKHKEAAQKEFNHLIEKLDGNIYIAVKTRQGLGSAGHWINQKRVQIKVDDANAFEEYNDLLGEYEYGYGEYGYNEYNNNNMILLIILSFCFFIVFCLCLSIISGGSCYVFGRYNHQLFEKKKRKC